MFQTIYTYIYGLTKKRLEESNRPEYLFMALLHCFQMIFLSNISFRIKKILELYFFTT